MPDDKADSAAPPPRPTSAEREAVVTRLSDAFAHDAISLEEFEQRVASAYAAPSQRELTSLLADLPAPVAPASVARVRTRGVPVEVVPRRVGAIFGNVERGGAIEIPARLDVRSYFGNVELDLSTARFSSDLTEISVRAFCGNVELRVPADAVVENHGTGILASFTCRVPPSVHAGDDVPGIVRLRIVGWAVLSSVDVKADSGGASGLLTSGADQT